MILYKYRSACEEKHLDALTQNYFYASPVKNLNDPCEGMINSEHYFSQVAVFQAMFEKKVPAKDFDTIKNQTNSLLDKALAVGVFSLSKSHKDELLWAHYANSHNGYCIGYDLSILKKSFKDYMCNVMEVKYELEPPVLELDDLISGSDKNVVLLKLIGTKSQKWINEEEVRLVMEKVEKNFYDFRAVKKIYFGINMQADQKRKIIDRLAGRNIEYSQMALEKNSYNFRSDIIINKNNEYPKYLYCVSPIMEDCIIEREVPEHFKEYIPYLYKAVEVARREPYCLQVNMAGFSHKSTDKDILIYVHCDRNDNVYTNYDYTLPQIDEKYSMIKDL